MIKQLKNRWARLRTRAHAEPPAAPATPATHVVADPELYDAYVGGWFHRDTQELFSGFTVTPEDSVLDIGCGDGMFAKYCADLGAEMIVADIDGEKISRLAEELRNSKARAITALVTDANPVPLPDGRVNRIVAMEVLEHVPDPVLFMNELVRLGSSGARYLISVPDPVSEHVQEELAPPIYFQPPNHIRIFGRDEFAKLVTDSGLIIEKHTRYGFYRAIWWNFFWACKQDLSPPWHPLLESWSQTWGLLLSLPDGPRIKAALDKAFPKSQAIIARKP